MKIKNTDNLEVEVKKLQLEPGECLCIQVDDKLEITRMADVTHMAKSFSQIFPNNPIAILIPGITLFTVQASALPKEEVSMPHSEEDYPDEYDVHESEVSDNG